jgi:hypothetical protein
LRPEHERGSMRALKSRPEFPMGKKTTPGG